VRQELGGGLVQDQAKKEQTPAIHADIAAAASTRADRLLLSAQKALARVAPARSAGGL